jgi:hypothetical protein
LGMCMVESLLNPRGDEITGSSVQSDRRDRDPNTCSDHAISSLSPILIGDWYPLVLETASPSWKTS